MDRLEELNDKVKRELLLSDARGIYIPRDFLEIENICNKDGSEITDKYILECLEDISNHENRYYWDAWDTILNNVYVYKEDGQNVEVYGLYQDGNLWAICEDDINSLSDDDKETYWNEVLN